MNGNTELLKIYSQEENSKASQLNPTLESYLRTNSVVGTDARGLGMPIKQSNFNYGHTSF